MKRMMMIALAVVATYSAWAQEKEAPKPNVNKALNLARQSKFDEAKAIVDGVPTHSKTMNDAKSWFFRGIVYACMDTSRKYTGGAIDNAKTAGEAFNKALTLAGPKANSLTVIENTETLSILQVTERFTTKFKIEGDKLYREEKYKEALKQLEKSLDITQDTAIYRYAGYAAYYAEDIDKAILYEGKYIEMGGRNEQATFLRVGAIYEYKKDCEQTIIAAREALKIFPNNVNIRKYELNCLLDLKRYQEATDNLKLAIKADPKDVETYFLMGALYEQLKNREEARSYFEQALKLNPQHVNSAIAMGKIKDFEGWMATKSEMEKLDFKKDKDKMLELDKKYLVQMNESVQRWEAISKLDQNNTEVLDKLYLLYGQLEMKDKLNATISRMKALGIDVD